MKFFATKFSTKVLSRHPDFDDVIIFHIGIECASCAKPQSSNVISTNKGFSLWTMQSHNQNRVNCVLAIMDWIVLSSV